ncbi:MAG: VWA domain-containing protein [Sulfurimonas sp.]|nr:VWA domain-containing protein [Sulfurimonas sp.]
MLKDDLYPSRLEFALSKLKTIMQSDSNLRVGLLLFANNAYVAHPLSEDKSSVLFISKNIDYSKVMQNRTNLFAALEGATLMLKDYKRKNLLILSDIGSLEGFNDESKYIKDYNLSVNIISTSATSTYSSDDINVVLKKLSRSRGKRQ